MYVAWYKKILGFEVYFSDNMYAVLYRENICIHLQWHACTENDPLNANASIRIAVKNVKAIFNLIKAKGVDTKFIANTPWKTNEFGFYDLNGNALFIMEDLNTI